ncbi:MAG: serine protease [Actinobacteria bacterium]|nr:serine protease [Actinomycetota bacterium]
MHPGVQTYTRGAQCTANFVFTNGATVYIGQAAHCAGTGAATETDGCRAATLPVGTPVTVKGASRPGVMVYSSWVTMQANREKDPATCAYNDLALIRLDPADAAKVNPSIPTWGGPVGINTSGARLGSRVYSYGNSSLRLGITLLSPKTGVSLGDTGGGWDHEVETVTPGIPGDSGSAFLDASGRALGVLSTVAVLPIPTSNGVGDIGRELNYARTRGGVVADLALGTEPFRANALPLG